MLPLFFLKINHISLPSSPSTIVTGLQERRGIAEERNGALRQTDKVSLSKGTALWITHVQKERRIKESGSPAD